MDWFVKAVGGRSPPYRIPADAERSTRYNCLVPSLSGDQAMMMHRTLLLTIALTSTIISSPASAAGPPPGAVQFNRDIRPILSENCLYCHGQDPNHREADLRLDQREPAIKDLGGYAAIVPGNPDASEIVKRLVTHDRDDKMPPAKANKVVTPEQVDLIKRWIAEGAPYQKHWAFETPVKPAPPAVKQADWPRDALDRFVLAKLEAEGLKPSPEVTPNGWLRRASLDLTGLPPTSKELDALEADVKARGEPAYAAAVDRLLASSAFGERLALDWLDAARYADTHGFNNDSSRSMWRWRDWVIDSFNANKPYDRFITEQLAGDLLPNATMEQRLATGFGRNHVINSEGGIIDEEYRVEYVADRVRTTTMAWVGLTFECARCHDHKFDPITQKDYYRFFAFFNSVQEFGEDGRVANAIPFMQAPTREQANRLREHESAIKQLDRQRFDRAALIDGRLEGDPAAKPATTQPAPSTLHLDADTATAKAKAWSFIGKPPALAPGVAGQAWVADGAGPLARIEGPTINFANKAGLTLSLWLNSAADTPKDAAILSSLDYSGSPADAGYGKGIEVRIVDGEIEFRASTRWPVYAMQVRTSGATIAPGQWRHVAVSVSPRDPAVQSHVPASLVRMFVDGREVETVALFDGLHGEFPSRSWTLAADNAKGSAPWRGMIDSVRAYPLPLDVAEIRDVFAEVAEPYAMKRRDTGKQTGLESFWLTESRRRLIDGEYAALAGRRDAEWERLLAGRRSLPTAMVMSELPTPRKTSVLNRGMYDAPGDAVEPGVPEDLLVGWPAGAPRNRLGLARWLTRPDHPLTARVVVNRWWAHLFGTGIVKSLEDFGFQSDWPSHPELLDHLARRFINRGWDVKAFFKSVVLSATYRQRSNVSAALLERDPENRLFARGPRVRLPAEILRDQAMAVSGLLKPRVGGPSVYPYQAAGVYEGIVVGANYPGTVWTQSMGDDLYRRSLYTFWKRTVPHPTMTTFDAPDREFCAVRRSRTNTPLQALALMNETGFVESARHLAARMLAEGGATDTDRLAFGFRVATSRRPSDTEAAALKRTLEKFRAEFAKDPAAAEAMLKVGVTPAGGHPANELAAMSVVASVILNLDEVVTKN